MRTSELFYWTPDMPELVLAQSREIFRYLQVNPDALKLIDCNIPFSQQRKQTWDTLVRCIIYNDYTKLNAFQTKKSSSCIHNDSDIWMWDIKSSDFKLLKSWEYGLKNVLESINECYIQKTNGQPTGFIGFVDGMYCLGSISREIDQ